MFKVTRSNTEIAITLMRIARFRLNMVGLQSFITAQPGYYEFSRSKGQRSRSQRNITYEYCYEQQKRYKTAMDRLIDFKLCPGVVIKADKDNSGVGRP